MNVDIGGLNQIYDGSTHLIGDFSPQKLSCLLSADIVMPMGKPRFIISEMKLLSMLLHFVTLVITTRMDHAHTFRLATSIRYILLFLRFTHASPTLFNAGTCRPQLSSCFLLAMQSDSIEGIYDTLTQCAKISKSAGGIGLHVHCIRASGSYIAGVSEIRHLLGQYQGDTGTCWDSIRVTRAPAGTVSG